ncbi:hypothetical protein JCM10212_002172 [Sporobolomyces blumeae]
MLTFGSLSNPNAEWDLHETPFQLENVILSTSSTFPKVQLADFGQSTFADRDFRSLKGTLQYMAPEQLVGWTRRQGYDGKLADMWSSGILLAFLLTGQHPFEPFSSPAPSASPLSPTNVEARPTRRQRPNDPGRDGLDSIRTTEHEPDDDVVAEPSTRLLDHSPSLSDFGQTARGELVENDVERQLCTNVVRGDVGLPRLAFGSGDFAVRTLLSSLLSPSPRSRVRARAALESRWIVSSKQELEALYDKVVGFEGR